MTEINTRLLNFVFLFWISNQIWYQKAADNGYNVAQFYLGRLYKNGEGTEKNLEKAFYWY